jgi:HEAT repeat protein
MTRVLRIVALTFWSAVLFAQVPFEQITKDLTSPNADVRLKAVRQLKSTAYPEAAVPLAAAVTDSEDTVQFEAIAAAMNIYLAEKIIPRKRVALVVEVRSKIAAEATFSEGPLALNAQVVPDALLVALLRASRDDNPRVALDALYTFGALVDNQSPASRASLRTTAGPDLTGLLGVPQLELRLAAARVIGRVYERHATEPPIDEFVGDSVVRAVNDSERDVRFAAMEALGAMRYERAVKSLTDMYLYYRRHEIGAGALQTLARIGHDSSVPIFEESLAGKDELQRVAAIEGLARVGDPASAARIQTAVAREKNESVLLSARFADVLLAKGRLDPLFDALAKTKLREQATRYLFEVVNGRTSMFAVAAKNPSAQIRGDIADVLGLSRDSAASAVLGPLAQDADPAVALAARRATARLALITARQ